jgi:hypothetical protein
MRFQEATSCSFASRLHDDDPSNIDHTQHGAKVAVVPFAPISRRLEVVYICFVLGCGAPSTVDQPRPVRPSSPQFPTFQLADRSGIGNLWAILVRVRRRRSRSLQASLKFLRQQIDTTTFFLQEKPSPRSCQCALYLASQNRRSFVHSIAICTNSRSRYPCPLPLDHDIPTLVPAIHPEQLKHTTQAAPAPAKFLEHRYQPYIDTLSLDR